MTPAWQDGAVDIAERVLSQAVADDGALWWPATAPDCAGGPPGQGSVSLWGGTGGVSLFLAELYGVTGVEAYWTAARRGIEWCLEKLWNLPGPRRACFLNGGLGVVYILCRMADIGRDRGLLDRAVRTARQIVDRGHRFSRFDFFGGAGGALWVLLQLERRVESSEVGDWLDDALSQILAGARRHRQGIFWDTDPRSGEPVCGFAHGQSGVAFALMEALERAENEPLRFLIDEAFRCENQCFDSARSDRAVQPVRQAGARPRPPTRANGWCRGAAGIGMARIRAVGLGFPAQLAHAEAAIRSTREDIFDALEHRTWCTYTLCHGQGGLGELFRVASPASDAAEDGIAEAVGRAALQQLREMEGLLPGFNPPNHEDCSLFIGSAGIGHYFLRQIAPERVPSILAPWGGPAQSVGTWAPSSDSVASRMSDECRARMS